MRELLQKEIKNRIDPKDIPNHPWFKGNIDFELLKSQKIDPPFKPSSTSKLDFSNIDKCFLREEIAKSLKFCSDEEDDDGFYDDAFS